MLDKVKSYIENGNAVVGIEFGSTRIKAVLIGENHEPLASGSYEWENQFENGLWTYSLDRIWTGLQTCYKELKNDVENKYGVKLIKLASLGFSAMMHGYMAFNKEGELLVPFRTWRNTNTGAAAAELTKLLNFNIPLRWSISHLYQCILNKEEHIGAVDYFTTLAGYIHWKLTGEKVLGVGDASGMFPIDSIIMNYDEVMLDKFDALVKPYGFAWNIRDILPKVLLAGENAGYLTEEGAKLLDIDGELMAGVPVCPPEGDAGTGMAATNSVAVRTGNVSAGTSVFAMIVLEEAMKAVHEEIDMVTTPDGYPVAMVHCNNCTSDLNAWVNIFKEFAESFGMTVDMNQLFGTLYNKALEGDKDCGGLLAYNYFSGEPVTGFEEGRPLFVRQVNCNFNLANFMRSHLYASLSALKYGLDILFKEETVNVDKVYGHGGLFKTKGVGQKILSAAMNTPVSVMETAGEGGAWGIALLAAYMVNKADGELLPDYLNHKVFAGQEGSTIEPDAANVEGFDAYMKKYVKALPVMAAAVANVDAE